MQELKEQFVNEVVRWVNLKVPYRHRGLTTTGCDCTGLVIGPLIALKLDQQFLGRGYQLRNYAMDWAQHGAEDNYIVDEMRRYFQEVSIGAPRERGDILVFTMDTCPSHVGILTDIRAQVFAHQHRLAGRCSYATLQSKGWSKRLTHVFRFKDPIAATQLKYMGDSRSVGMLGIGAALAFGGGWLAGAMGITGWGATMMVGAGWMVGTMLGGALFPMADASSSAKPLGDYPIQGMSAGTPIPVVYGTTKLAGNIIWAGPLKHRTIKHESGGKGMGGSGAEYEEIQYYRSFLIAVCEGPANLLRIWANTDEIDMDSVTWFSGADNSGIEALTGLEHTTFRRLACAFFDSYELGATPMIPNFVFEVSTQVTAQFPSIVVPSNGRLYVYDANMQLVRYHNTQDSSCSCADVAPDGRYAAGSILDASPSSAFNLWLADGTDSGVVFDTTSILAIDNQWTVEGIQFSRDGNFIYANLHALYPYIRLYCKWNSHTGVLLNIFEVPADRSISTSSPHGVVDPFERYCSCGGVLWNPYKTPAPGLTSVINSWVLLDKNGDAICYFGSPGNYGWPAQDVIINVKGICYIGAYGIFACAFQKNAENNSFGIGFSTAMNAGPLGAGPGYFKLEQWDESDSTKYAYATATDGRNLYVWGQVRTDGTTLSKYTVGWEVDSLGDIVLTLDEVARIRVIPASLTLKNPSCLAVHGKSLWVLWTEGSAGTNAFEVELDSFTIIQSVRAVGVGYSTWPGAPIRAAWGSLSRVMYGDTDLNLAEIIYDLLTNTRYGAGISTSLIDTTSYRLVSTFCEQQGIYGSLALTSQRPVLDWVMYLCSHFEGYIYWSQGILHFGVYKEDTAIATLTNDDFKVAESIDPAVPGADAIEITKRKYTETVNRIEVVYTNRDKNYAKAVVVVNDEVDQRVSNQVRKRTITLEAFHDSEIAQKAAQRLLANAMYRFSGYSFKLGFKGLVYDVGDVVTLNDGDLIQNDTVRITGLSEDENGADIIVTAVEDVSGIYGEVEELAAQESESESYETPEPAACTTVFREDLNYPLLHLCAIPASTACDGVVFYKSYDGVTYSALGRAFTGDPTTGLMNVQTTLINNLPTAKAVTYRAQEGVLISVPTDISLPTTDDMGALLRNERLIQVGNEIIGYRVASEVSTGIWKLEGLLRGLMGTLSTAHLAGETVSTLLNTMTIAIEEGDVGKTLHIKAVSFYGTRIAGLSSTIASTYTIRGNYSRPAAVSLVRLTVTEREGHLSQFSASPFNLYWNLASKTSGFNRGGYDVHPSKPIWRYGDSEAYLLRSNGVPYGNYQQDPELQAIDLIFEQPDGTPLGMRSTSVAETAEINQTTDLGSLSEAVVKVSPRRVLGAIKDTALELEAV